MQSFQDWNTILGMTDASMLRTIFLAAFCAFVGNSKLDAQTVVDVDLRSQDEAGKEHTESQRWKSAETAVIVCDVWDYHHCLNAVRRVEEFAPRLDRVLAELRKRGSIIIHAPSDCMDAYANHPARKRAISVPSSGDAPADIESWCSAIPSEEQAKYPIDQSDGGEDDDPVEHAEWAKELESLGRNPGSPWEKQTEMLTIDDSIDYISDRGDEVWNVLQKHAIKNVILVGVHTNMCVLGRPFGLRQMVRGGKNVVLMRDLTDTMYNPKRWPYVSHFEGTRRIVTHIERYVCPTISSDQIVGGDEFRFRGDKGESQSSDAAADPERDWTTVAIPDDASAAAASTRWYRCVVRVPESWRRESLMLETNCRESVGVWINGVQLEASDRGPTDQTVVIPGTHVNFNDASLLVVRVTRGGMPHAPVLKCGSEKLSLSGNWQLRIGDDSSFRNMPLPAKFGAGSDIVFAPRTGADR